MVVSPDINTFPDDYSACVVCVDAPNKSKAKAAALRTPAFRHWLGQTKNPFVGLKVYTTICEHGRCWCDMCNATNGECPECELKMELLHQEELEKYNNEYNHQ